MEFRLVYILNIFGTEPTMKLWMPCAILLMLPCQHLRFPFVSGCRSCSAGTYGVGSGRKTSDACVKCSPGTYGTGIGASSPSICTDCAVGTYVFQYGASSPSDCRGCDAGYYGDGKVCTPCPAGYYSFYTSLQCLSCPTGTWSDVEKATDPSFCNNCPANTYQPAEHAVSSSQCISCPTGTVTVSDGAGSIKQCGTSEAGIYISYTQTIAVTIEIKDELYNEATLSVYLRSMVGDKGIIMVNGVVLA